MTPLRREDRRRLVSAGVVDGPSAARAITKTLLGTLEQTASALDAELLLSEYLGMVRESERAARVRYSDGAPQDAALAALLGEITVSAEAARTPAAVGLLRLLASFALPVGDVSQAAADAAQRLVAAGISGPRWSEGVGRPEFVDAWRMGDVLRFQESVSVAFETGHRRHCLNVLVDHDLGGGVKDVWPAVGRDVVVLRQRAMATPRSQPNAVFDDLDLAAVHGLLARALAREPCPRQPDQHEDVRSHLALLGSRVAHLGRLISAP